MASIHDTVLRVLGDASDAERELRKFSAEFDEFAAKEATATLDINDVSVTRKLDEARKALAEFARETATADADVNTAAALLDLDALKQALADIDRERATPEVNAKVAKAELDLAALQAELDRLDGEDVVIDLKVRQTIGSKLASLTRDLEGLGRESEKASDALSGGGGLSGAMQDAEGAAGGFGLSLGRVAAVAAPVLIAVLVAVVGQLAALIASAANAVAGLGALAVAFGATIPAGIALGIGAILRFKETAGQAGTAAHALSNTFKGVSEAFKNATAGGADALFRGLSGALKTLKPLVQSLGPAFTRLGKAGGDAFRLLGKQFSSPAWTKFFSFTTNSLARLTPLFARSFGAFAAVLRNIATAAMPFLIQGFRLLARGLEALAGKTSDIKGLRDGIGGMVESLKAWGHLLGGVIKLGAAFITAFAPIGDKIVKALGDGAEHLAEWLQSKEGLERIKTFFKETGPLAAELGKLFLNLLKLTIQIGQFFAPLATVVVHGLNLIVEAISGVVDWMTKADRALAFKNLAAALGSALAAVGKFVASVINHWPEVSHQIGQVLNPINALKNAFGSLAGVAQDAGSRVAAEFRGLWTKVKNTVEQRIEFLLRVPRDAIGVARSVWSTVRATVQKAIHFALSVPRDAVGAARSLWRTVSGVVGKVIDFAMSVPKDPIGAARNLWNTVKGIISNTINFVLGFASGIVEKAKELWNSINDALPDIHIGLHIDGPLDLAKKLAGISKFETKAHKEITRARRRAKQEIEGIEKGLEHELHKIRLQEAKDEKNLSKQKAAARRQAKQGVEGIERGLARNITKIRRESAQEHKRLINEVAQARTAAAEEEENAIRAVADAERELRDSLLGTKEAAFSLLDAQDSLGDKQLELKEFLEELGLSGEALENVLHTLETADLGTLDVGGLLAGAGVTSLTPEQIEKLGTLAQVTEKVSDDARELQEAQLGVERATNGVTDANTRLSESQERVNEFATKGLLAFKPFAEATHAVKVAVENLKTAFGSLPAGAKASISSVEDATREGAKKSLHQVRRKGLRDGFFNAGKALVRKIGEGIEANGDRAPNAMGRVGEAIKAAVFVGFFDAGKKIVKKLAEGIEAEAREAVKAMKKVAEELKDQLPGSEPKDPTSPLRGLGRRGEALVGNFAEGIRAALPDLSRTLSAGLTAMVSVPELRAPTLAAAGSSSVTNNYDLTVQSPAGTIADPGLALARLGTELRARGGLG